MLPNNFPPVQRCTPPAFQCPKQQYEKLRGSVPGDEAETFCINFCYINGLTPKQGKVIPHDSEARLRYRYIHHDHMSCVHNYILLYIHACDM